MSKIKKNIITLAIISLFIVLLIASIFRGSKNNRFQRTNIFSSSYQTSLSNVGIFTTLSVEKDRAKIEISRNDSALQMALPLQNAKLEKKKEEMVYSTPDKNIEAHYQTITNGIKEEIVLNKKTGNNEYATELNLENLQIKSNSEGTLFFFDQKDNYQFHFLKPFAKDAKGNITYGVKYSLKEKSSFVSPVSPLKNPGNLNSSQKKKTLLGGLLPFPLSNSYILTITVDQNWLSDPNRVYPIIIDPSVVYDTSSEFAAGTLNRIKDIGSGSSPELLTYYHELPADNYTVGLYHLNNVWTDSSGKTNDLTATNTPTFTTSSVVGSHAGSFAAASSQYATRTYDADFDFGTGSFSVEAWFKHDTISAADYLISRYDTDQGFKIYMDASGDMCFDIDDDATWGPDDSACTPDFNYDDNNWHHVAAVKDGTAAIRLYVDAKEVASDVSLSATATLTSDSAPFTLASDEPTNGSYWDGQIDEVRVLKRALSPEEIKADAERRPYGIYTSDVLDLTSEASSLDSLQWAESGVQTGVGETVFSTANLVAQWNFNETSGTAANNDAEGTSCDGTPANCDGTVTNMTTTSQDAAAGDGWTADNKRWGAGALMFDATDGYVSVTDNNSLDLNNFTLEAWFNVNINKDYNTIFSKGNDAAENYELILDSLGRATYAIKWTDTTRTNTTIRLDIIPGNWYHIAEVFDGSSIKLYLNGFLQNTNTNFSKTPQTNAVNLLIGTESGVAGRYFDGIIDSARIYSRALTAAEILSNFQSANIEFQTRTGATATADDGTWEAWKPTTSETQILSMDSDQSNWIWSNTAPFLPIAKTNESTVKSEGTGSMKLSLGVGQTDANVIAFWHLDETNGDLAGNDVFDETSNDNDGEITNTTVVNGIFGKARSFDGNGDNISVADSVSIDITSGTIEGWFYPTACTANDKLVFRDDGSVNRFWQVQLTNTSCNVQFIGKAPTAWEYNITSSSTLTLNTWNHVAVTFSATTDTAYMYFNGVQVGTDTAAGDMVTGAQVIEIGGDASSAADSWNGLIDEVKISNTARTAEEIAEAYRLGRDHRLSQTIASTDLTNATKLPFYVAADRPGTYLEATIGESSYANYETDANTVGFWHLEEGAGLGNTGPTTSGWFKDSSNYGNNGTATGTSSIQGKIGKARKFVSASSQLITLPNSETILGSNPTTYTYSLWFNTSTIGTVMDLIADYDSATGDTNYGIYLRVTSGNLLSAETRSSGNTYDANSTATVTDGKWHQAAVVIDKSTLTMKGYLDGGLFASTAIGNYDYIDNVPVRVGCERYNGANYAFYNGLIDEIQISNTARTAAEIRQAYEVGLRTHPVTIDFASSPNAVDIAGTSEVNALTDTSFVLADDNMITNIFTSDTVIVKENYGGTEYLVQGTVSGINTGTRTITVASWSGTVPNPGTGVCGGSNTHCFTTGATVFKWQREWMDLTGIMIGSSVGDVQNQKDAITNLTLRVTNDAEGRTVYLDDFRYGGAYLTDNAASANITSAVQRYFQFRAILSSSDTLVSPSLNGVTLNYGFITAPSVCVVDESNLPNQLILKWADNSSNETGFRIERNTDEAGFSLLTTTAANAVSQTDATTSSGHTYQYRVRAENSASSTYSGWCSSTMLTFGTGNFKFSGVKMEGLQIQ